MSADIKRRLREAKIIGSTLYAEAADHIESLERRIAELEKDAALAQWIKSVPCNSLHITRDGDHACNYMTAKQWIEEAAPDDFSDCPPEVVQAMKDANTIWRVQIYPDTPIGFYAAHGSTLDEAVAAIEAGKEPE
jgi:hypothetical protein